MVRKAKRATRTREILIGPTLLGELRAAFRDRVAVLALIEEHNAQGQKLQRRYDAADAVFEHFVHRARKAARMPPAAKVEVNVDRGTIRLLGSD